MHVTVLNTVDKCNTMVSVIILYYYNNMGPSSYMQSIVDRCVIMQRTPVTGQKDFEVSLALPVGTLLQNPCLCCCLPNCITPLCSVDCYGSRLCVF